MFRRYHPACPTGVVAGGAATAPNMLSLGIRTISTARPTQTRRQRLPPKQQHQATTLDPKMVEFARQKMKEIEEEMERSAAAEKKKNRTPSQLSVEERVDKLTQPSGGSRSDKLPVAVVGVEPKVVDPETLPSTPIRWETTGAIGRRKLRLETALNKLLLDLEKLRPTIFVPTTGMGIRMQQAGEAKFYFDGEEVVMKSIADLRDGAAGELQQTLSFLRPYSWDDDIGGEDTTTSFPRSSVSSCALSEAKEILLEHQWYWEYPEVVEISEAYGTVGVEILRRQEMIWAAFRSLSTVDISEGPMSTTKRSQLVQLLDQCTRSQFARDPSSSVQSIGEEASSTSFAPPNSYEFGAAQKILRETYRPILQLAYLEHENSIIEKTQALADQHKKDQQQAPPTVVDDDSGLETLTNDELLVVKAEPAFASSSARRSKIVRDSWNNAMLEAELGIASFISL